MKTQDPVVSSDIKEMESDEMWHFIGSKNKLWIIKAVDRITWRTVACVTDSCDAATFQRLYDKASHLRKCHFYTDDWDAFSKILSKEQHTIGKSCTVCIERDNRFCIVCFNNTSDITSSISFVSNNSFNFTPRLLSA